MFSVIWYGLNGQHGRFALLSNIASSKCCVHILSRCLSLLPESRGASLTPLNAETLVPLALQSRTLVPRSHWKRCEWWCHTFQCTFFLFTLAPCLAISVWSDWPEGIFKIKCKQAQWKLCCFILQNTASSFWLWYVDMSRNNSGEGEQTLNLRDFLLPRMKLWPSHVWTLIAKSVRV